MCYQLHATSDKLANNHVRLTVVIPVLNEAKILADTVEAVYARLLEEFAEGDFRLVIVDNGSTDGTGAVVGALLAEYPGLRYERLNCRGKGLAIRTGWQRHPAAVNVFMDADLATDLAALKPLVLAVEEGADMAVGSRYHPASVVERSFWRRLCSLGYRLVLRTRLGLRTADAPCGFKAVSARVLNEIVPIVRNERWFFDTELLVRAERAGCRIAEIPVSWHEDSVAGRRSRVSVFRVAWQYFRECERLRNDLGV